MECRVEVEVKLDSKLTAVPPKAGVRGVLCMPSGKWKQNNRI